MSRSSLLLSVLLLALTTLAATVAPPDVIPDGHRPLKWLGTTLERGDFDTPRGAGWRLMVDIPPNFSNVIEIVEAETELPSGRYGYRLMALPAAAAELWFTADDATRDRGLREFAREHGIEAISLPGSRADVREASEVRAFRARYRATLDDAGKPGVERVSYEAFDAAGELIPEADIAPPPAPLIGEDTPWWSVALVVVALGGGLVWLLRRRRRSA